jgi:hypothetical protein
LVLLPFHSANDAAFGHADFWNRQRNAAWPVGGSVEGLYDRTRANHHLALRIAPELERTILSIRRRLQAHTAGNGVSFRSWISWFVS